MKTLLLAVSLAVAGLTPAHAQILRSSVGGGAALGAVAGSLIGGHNGGRWTEGAIMGAVAGALIGAAVEPQPLVYSPPPRVIYGQQVYGQPGSTIPDAAVVPMASAMGDQVPVQVVTAPPPQGVYVGSAPRTVYVTAPALRVIYAAPTVVRYGFGSHAGPRDIPVSRGGHPHHGHGHRR